MSGGIALVLYQSGVAHELLRLSRYNKLGAGSIYARVVEQTGIHPVLDIVTGASAGAINCVMLGHSLVAGTDYRAFHDIWINNADVSKMWWPDNTPMEKVKSILFRDNLVGSVSNEINAQISSLNGQLPTDSPHDDDLKVFCCRTDLNGVKISAQDSLGHNMDDMTRNSVASFNASDFGTSKTLNSLIEAGVASSSFPGAFPPTFDDAIKHWYCDGGLWNNYPLNLAVEAVKDKPAFGKTHRVVLLVQPEPLQVVQDESEVEPNWLQIVTGILGIGMNGSTWPAIKEITNINARTSLMKVLLTSHKNDLASFGSILLNEARQQIADATANEKCVELKLLNEARIREIFLDNDADLIHRLDQLRSRLDEELLSKLNASFLSALKGLDEKDLLRHALRRVIRETTSQYDIGNNDHSKKAMLYNQLTELNAQLTRSSLNTSIDHELIAQIHDPHERMSAFKPKTEELLKTLEQSNIDQFTPAINLWSTNIRNIQNNWDDLTIQVNLSTYGSFNQFCNRHRVYVQDEIQFDPEEVNVSADDALNVVFGSISDLSGKSSTDLLRISPNDTDNLSLIGKTKDDLSGMSRAQFKLAGEGLGHFGGFLEIDWRRNDYIWARLDAAELLLKTIANAANHDNPGSITTEQLTAWTQEVRKEILVEEACWCTDPDINVATTISGIADMNNLSSDQIAAIRKLIGRGITAATHMHVPVQDNASHLEEAAYSMIRNVTPGGFLTTAEKWLQFFGQNKAKEFIENFLTKA